MSIKSVNKLDPRIKISYKHKVNPTKTGLKFK